MSMSYDEKRDALRAAVNSRMATENDFIYIMDMWDDKFVFESQNTLYMASYMLGEEGGVILGDPVEVKSRTVYDVIESLRTLTADIVQEATKHDLKGKKGDTDEWVKEAVVCEGEGAARLMDKGHSILENIRSLTYQKLEEGALYPSDAYCYVPDKSDPETWSLRMWENPTKKVTRAQLKELSALLSPGGLKGVMAEVPQEELSAVKATIRGAYRSIGVGFQDMPKWVKEADMEQRQRIFESVSIDLKEATPEGIAEGLIPIRIIQPGFNTSKSSFYSEQAIKDAATIFEGAKMYADHPAEGDRPERSIRDWVAVIEGAKVSDAGNAVGRARIHAPWLKEMVSSLHSAGTLDQLGTSINAIGSGVNQVVEGHKTFLVENLIKTVGQSVDFVTEPGAGGRAGLTESSHDKIVDADLIDLAQLKETRPDLVQAIESEITDKLKQEVKEAMDMEKENADLKEKLETVTTELETANGKIKENDEAQVKAEAQTAISKAIGESNLPDVAKTKLTEQFKEAVTSEGIEEAIKTEAEYIAAFDKKGSVVGLGESVETDQTEEQMIETAKTLRPDWTEEQCKTFARGR